MVNQFSWAQWEPQYQCLYYIHYSNMAHSNADEASLSALQFHDEPQHETVVIIFHSLKYLLLILNCYIVN